MKKLFTLVLCAFISVSSFAQADSAAANEVAGALTGKSGATAQGWTKSGLLNIGIAQGMLQNWAAGGERYSMAINGVFNGFATHINDNKLFENTLDAYYGLNYVQSNNFVPRKIDDRIDASSRYGVKPYSWADKNILKHTYVGGMVRAQTQFSKGFNYALPNWETMNNGDGISSFLSPLMITAAAGFDYRPNSNFSVFFSPAAARLIFASAKHTILNPTGNFGIDYGETFAFQFGAYLTARYQTALSDRIDYRTRLDLYSNYLNEPQNVDILWDNFFAMKLSNAVGVGLGVTLQYDHDIPGQREADGTLGPLGWTQLKQILNVGINYKF